MSGRGRPKKPTECHIIEGTFNSSRHSNRPTVVAENSKPIAPFKLDPDVQEVWDFYINRLPWNSETESDSFLMFCDLAADCRKSLQGLNTKYTWSPALMAQYKSIRTELGIGYAEQMKMTMPKKGGEIENKELEHFDD